MQSLSGSPAFKVQVMCEGIRYSEALGRAALHSMPNYYPYRFKAGEHDPTGKGTATIPYLINLGDGTEIRILGSGDSPWHVEGDRDQGYRLIDDRDGRIALLPIRVGRGRDGCGGSGFLAHLRVGHGHGDHDQDRGKGRD